MQPEPDIRDFFSSLPEQVRHDLKAHSVERRLAKGQALYRHGDASDEIYQLIEGGIRLSNLTFEGKEIVLVDFRPGDAFGEMGVIDGLARHSDAVATRDSRVMVIRKKQFLVLCEKHPEINRCMLVTLAKRLRSLFQMTEEIRVLSLQQRLVRILLRRAYSHGVRDAGGEIRVEVSQEVLATMLGVSRQSVSKELQLLKDQGCVAVRYGKLHILDLPRLTEISEETFDNELVEPFYSE